MISLLCYCVLYQARAKCSGSPAPPCRWRPRRVPGEGGREGPLAPDDRAPNPFWDPLGLWPVRSGAPGAPWRLGGLDTAAAAGSTPLRWLVDVARSQLVGRRVRWE